MADTDETLFCTPEPRLYAGDGASKGISAAFEAGDAHGILYLATTAPESELDAPLNWAREWGRQFVARLCQTRDPKAAAAPGEEVQTEFASEAPPMRGAEYISSALLLRHWQE